VTVRGCVFGAWQVLVDRGVCTRERGSSSIFDELEESYRTVGRPDHEAIADHWQTGQVQGVLDLGGTS
jgi:hypothetical protein